MSEPLTMSFYSLKIDIGDIGWPTSGTSVDRHRGRRFGGSGRGCDEA